MKKYILQTLLVCAATQVLATIETVVYPYNAAETLVTKISGTETYTANSVTWSNLWLADADLTLATNNKNITVGDGNTKNLSVGGGNYLVSVEGDTSLTLNNGAKFIIYGSASMGIMSGSNFTLTIRGNSYIRAHKFFSNADTTTLNLYTTTAINQEKMTIGASSGKEIVINMDCNQSFALDARNNTTYNLNITDGAILTIKGTMLAINGTTPSATTFKIDNGLVDGSILFLIDTEDAVQKTYSNTYSWDADESKLTITSRENGTTRTQIASFVGTDENPLKNLSWDLNDAGTGYILSYVTVPEPAEWAAIFGAIALGLAVYRRRK